MLQPLYFQLFIALVIVIVSITKPQAKTLDAAVGWTKPPYVIAETNSGFELELVSAIMATLGHKVNHIYVPFGRSYSMLSDGEVDMTLTVGSRGQLPNMILSDVYINYQNVAIALKSTNINISKITELEHYSVVAFQNASTLLGEQYQQTIAKCAMYMELPYQRNQVEMLLQGNIDIAVMDVNIFMHLSELISGTSQLDKVDIFRLFPVNNYRIGFKDALLKDQFNQALASYMKSDDYLKLIKKYQLFPANMY